MKCLITGAAGFIGSHLVDRLLAGGASVVGIDNLSLGRRGNLAQARRSAAFRLFEIDVNDTPAMRRMLEAESRERPIDLVWHLAANSDIRAGSLEPDRELTDTFLSTYRLVAHMRELAIRRLVFTSTSAIYGKREERLGEASGPLFPISNYGAMKLASEAVISAALESFLERAWILRFPNVVGSRATHGAIYDFVRQLAGGAEVLTVLGDGTQEKPYCHVSELVDAMMFIVERADEPLNCFNIGPGETATTVRYIAESVVRQMRSPVAIRYGTGDRGWVGDVPRFRFSVERLRSLGWSPRLTSDAAVDLAVSEVVAETAR